MRIAALILSLFLLPSVARATLDAPTLLIPLDGAHCPSDTIRVTMRWEPVDGAVSYRVGVGVGEDSCEAPQVFNVSEPVLSYLMWGGVRQWWVEAVDADGAFGERSECWTYTAPFPPELSGLTVVREPGPPNHYRFSWDANPDADSYEVGIYTSCSPTAGPLATYPTPVNSIVIDLAIHDLSRLLYGRVKTRLCSGFSSGFDGCVPANCDRFDPPAPPTDVAAEALECAGEIRVTWESGGVQSVVYRDDEEVYTTGGELFLDTGLEPGRTYRYHVRAITACHESGPSSEAEAVPIASTPLAAPALVAPADGTECAVDGFNYVNFSWTPVDSAVVYRIGYGGDDCDDVNATRLTPVPEFRAYVGEEPVHRWWVEAIDDCEDAGPRSPCYTFTGAVAPAKPAVSAVYDPEAVGLVTLDWTTGEGAVGYEVVIAEACGPSGVEFVRFETASSDTTLDLEAWMDEPALVASVRQFQCNGQFSLPGCRTIEFPTPVLLESFGAEVRDGRVELRWRTRTVDGAIGFHVWRAPGEGSFTRLTTTPLPLSEDGSYLYADLDAAGGTTYRYRLDEVLPSGETGALGTTRITTPPRSLALTVRPNPFNPRTTLSIDVPVGGDVRLHVFDGAGRIVRRLFDAPLTAGRHEVVWDGRDDARRPVASGVYYARLTVGGRDRVERLVVLR